MLLTHTQRGRAVTTPAILLVAAPDRLRLELQDPVGSLLGLLVIKGDQFWLYRHDARENLTGPLARLPADLGLPFRAEDLARVILARPYFERFAGAPAGERFAKSAAKAGTVEANGETLRWSTDPLEPREWTRREANGGLFGAVYEEYESRSGTRFPTRVKLREEATQREVLLAWKDWEPSVPKDEKLFQIPQQQQFGRPTKALR